MSALLLDTHIWLWYAEGDDEHLASQSVQRLDQARAAAAESTLLPGSPHGDPADRFLIAAARAKRLLLATRDREIIHYGKSGHVRVLEL